MHDHGVADPDAATEGRETGVIDGLARSVKVPVSGADPLLLNPGDRLGVP